MRQSTTRSRWSSAGLGALCLWMWLGGVGCGRCHTQHTIVSYTAAYTTVETVCSGGATVCSGGKYPSCVTTPRVCIPYTQYHPAACWVGTQCDLRCKDLDKGRAEAHPKHEPLHLFKDEVDPHCNLQGQVTGNW